MTNRLCGGVLLMVALAVSVVALPARSQTPALALAVSPGVGTTSIRRAELLRILSGMQATWPDGRPAVVLLPPQGSPALQLLADLLGVSAPGFRRFAMSQAYRGSARIRLVVSGRATRETLLSTPGAVGVLPAAAAGPPLRRITIL